MLKDVFALYDVYLDNFKVEDTMQLRKLIKSGHYKEFVYSVSNTIDEDYLDLWDMKFASVIDSTILKFIHSSKAIDLETGEALDISVIEHAARNLSRSVWKHQLNEGHIQNLDELSNITDHVVTEEVVWIIIQYMYFVSTTPGVIETWKNDIVKDYVELEEYLSKKRD